MQNVGLQTVLGMSNAATQVQAVSQSGATVASEQAKDTLEKQTVEKKETVQESQETDTDASKIREEDQRKQEQKRREAFFKSKSDGEPVEEIVAEQSQAGSESTQGQLLNIKV